MSAKKDTEARRAHGCLGRHTVQDPGGTALDYSQQAFLQPVALLWATSVINKCLGKSTVEGGSFHVINTEGFDGHWLQNVTEN